MMGGRVLMTGPAWRWITKNTWEGKQGETVFFSEAYFSC